MALDNPRFASSGATKVGYCKAVSMGKIPEDPVLKLLRRTSFTVSPNTETFTSAELTGNRQSQGSSQGGRSADAELATEISPGSHADFMAAALGGWWVTPTPIDATTTTLTATLVNERLEVTATSFNFITAQLYVGAPVTFTGSGTAVLNGTVFIVAGHATNKIILIPPRDFTLGAPATVNTGTFGLKGARVGIDIVNQDFVFEQAYTDIGSFIVSLGQFVNTMAVNVPTTGPATATYAMTGIDIRSIDDQSIDGVAEVVVNATGATSLTFDGAASTITRAAGSWVTDGIEAGDKIAIDGTGITDVQNRNLRTVIKVTATVLTVAEAIQSGGPYTTPFTVTRVGLPDYAQASDERVLTSASGVFLVNGNKVGTLTDFSFTHNNAMGSSSPVGSQTRAAVFFGNVAETAGQVTVLFDKGGTGEELYNAYIDNTDNNTIVAALTSSGATEAVVFAFGRTSITSGNIPDAVENGLPIPVGFTASQPQADHPEVGTSQIYIYDTTITGVAPA